MTIDNIKVPVVSCDNCDMPMDIVEQIHPKDSNNLQIKYKCKCGRSALVLMFLSEMHYNEYIKDTDNTLISFKERPIEND